MRKQVQLDSFEAGIEARSAEYAPMKGEKREQVEALLATARKTRSINIRISEHDLASIKEKAAQEGIPYQTLISSVLHKYVGDRLVDEASILKSLQLMANR